MTEPKIRFKQDDGSSFPDWEEKTLDDIATRVTRKNSNNETDIPLTISSLDGLVDQRTYFGKTVASKDMSGYFLLKNGEFAYNKSYSVGYDYGSIKRLDNYEQGALSTLYICFSLNDNRMSDYMVHYFNSLVWNREMPKICAEGARNHGLLNVSPADFFKINFSLPVSIEEQQKIADFLSNVDEVIAASEEEVSNLEKQKKGMMQKIFSQEVRFKKEDGSDFPDWEKISFDALYEPLNNNTYSRDCLNYKSGEAKNIHYGDILVKFGEICDVQKVELPFVSDGNVVQKYAYLQDGDIVLADTAEDETVGKAIEIYNVNGENIISGLHTMVCRPRLSFVPKYLGYYMNSSSYHSQLKPYMQGIKVTSIGRKNIAETMISYPSDEKEQQLIVDFFTNYTEAITAAKQELAKWKELKKGLLQQMFV